MRLGEEMGCVPLLAGDSEKFEVEMQAARAISTGQLRALTALPLPAYRRRSLRRLFRGLPPGDLILRVASRLDAFSGYPFRTRLPSDATGVTTGTPAVRPSRSSRTKDRSSQISYAHSR